MSIIHDALKKVQQGLTPKADKTPVNGHATNLQAEATTNSTDQSHLYKKINSILALLCAIAITVVSALSFNNFKKIFPRPKNGPKIILK